METNLSWLQKHERLLIVVLGVVLLLGLGNKYLNHSADKALAEAAAAKQILQIQISENAKLAELAKQQNAEYTTLFTAVTAENTKLAQAIAARDAAVRTQQGIDRNLPLAGLAQRWAQLLNLQPTDVVAGATNLTVSDPGARSTVQQLELVPILQQDVKDFQTTVVNKDKQIDGLNNVVGVQQRQVDGLLVQLTDADTAHKTEIKNVKAQARKGKRNWFIAGFVTGFATRSFLKF